MAEIYRFFDSAADDERTYPADHFAEYFRGIIRDGIQYDNEEGLQVTASGADMTTTLNVGAAFVQGYQYVLTEPLQFVHDNPDPTNDRIDRIVLRLDKSIEKREIKAVLKKGVPTATPEVPALERAGDVYEYPLAQIRIVAGQAYILPEAVTIEAEKARILNNKYRQIFISTEDPDPSMGSEGDLWIRYEP